MSNDEYKALKEELLKEIHELEQKTNFQITLKNQELNEKCKKYFEEFNTMNEKNKSLLNSLSLQKINLEKINDFDNFRKKMESMIITHEIRINNSIKDIKEIQFKLGKEISENLSVPGYVGPSCKYKTISNYISTNINEIDKIKNENEIFKKDIKEIKKKLEEIIKTVITLVDGSNSKCIEYIDRKNTKIEENMKKIIEEFSDKIINFKSLLMTQEKIKELNENMLIKYQSNNYNKTEVDDIIKNVINNFEIKLENFKLNYDDEINNLIKISSEKLEAEIKENNNPINEIKNKIAKMVEIQNQLMKNDISLKNLIKNYKENNSYNNNKIPSITTSFNNNRKLTLKEEEKYINFRNNNRLEKNKTIDSLEEVKNKNNYLPSEPSPFREKAKIIKINKSYFNNNEMNKKDLNNNNISINDKIKQDNIYNTISEDNKSSNNDYNYKLDLSNFKSDLSNNINESIKKDINNSPYKAKLINTENENKNKTIDAKSTSLLKKNLHNNNIIIKKQKNNQNIIPNKFSFGMRNPEVVVENIDSNKNYKEFLVKDEDKEDESDKNNEKQIIGDYFPDREKKFEILNNKKRGYSLHKLASVNFDEKVNKLFPNIKSFSNKNLGNIIKKPKSSVVKNVFYQKFQMNNILKDNLSIDIPVKITSAFGRTSYTFYDKKEDGINHLIKKGINNKLTKRIKNATELNIELSPVSKLKVYGNI